jgi:hypothetical protein
MASLPSPCVHFDLHHQANLLVLFQFTHEQVRIGIVPQPIRISPPVQAAGRMPGLYTHNPSEGAA